MPPKKDKGDERDKCGQCRNRVGEDGIQCEICDVWSHPKCVGISKEGYEALSSNSQIHWYCAACNLGVGNLINEVNRIKDMMNKQEMRVDGLGGKIDKLNGSVMEMQTCQRKLEDNFDKVAGQMEELKKQVEGIGNKHATLENKMEIKELTKAFIKDDLWTDVVKKEVVNNLENMRDNIQEIEKTAVQTKSYVEEARDKESRRKNIVIYRVKESDAESYKDRLGHDTHLVYELLRHTTRMGEDDVGLAKIVRFGKREDGRVRPLLIEFENIAHKNLLMQNVYKMKEAPDIIKSMIITHDLTQGERDECKKLVQEARDREENEQSGEWVYRVRGPPGNMKIVRWRKN